MEIRQLMYFIQIVKSGTYSAAAKQLYLSQPALSKAVKHLEEELGAKLLVQGDKRSEPTDVGRVLFERGQQLIREYNDLLGAVDEANSRNRGRLHFGIPYGLGQILFYRLTADFSRAFPEMELVVSGHGSAHIREEVLAGRLDIGATLIPPEPEPGLEATVIMRDQFFLLLPRAHPLAGRGALCPAAGGTVHPAQRGIRHDPYDPAELRNGGVCAPGEDRGQSIGLHRRIGGRRSVDRRDRRRALPF